MHELYRAALVLVLESSGEICFSLMSFYGFEKNQQGCTVQIACDATARNKEKPLQSFVQPVLLPGLAPRTASTDRAERHLLRAG